MNSSGNWRVRELGFMYMSVPSIAQWTRKQALKMVDRRLRISRDQDIDMARIQ